MGGSMSEEGPSISDGLVETDLIRLRDALAGMGRVHWQGRTVPVERVSVVRRDGYEAIIRLHPPPSAAVSSPLSIFAVKILEWSGKGMRLMDDRGCAYLLRPQSRRTTLSEQFLDRRHADRRNAA
jgi:hypothetical protein